MNFKITLGFLALSAVSYSCLAGPYDAEYESALRACPPLNRAHEDGVARRKQESRELSVIHADILERNAAFEGGLNGEDLRTLVRDRLTGDSEFFAGVSDGISALSAEEQAVLCFQLKSCKMSTGIELALGLLESSFDDILKETLPLGYSIEPPEVVTKGDEDHIYATSRGIGLKHLLAQTAMVLLGAPTLHELFHEVGLSTTTSPWIQPTPLSDLDFGTSPYVQSNTLNVIHNGYTYGGNRRVPEGHPYPALDCGDFVALYLECAYPVTTWHMVTQYQFDCGPIFPEFQAELNAARAQHTDDPWFAALKTRLTSVLEHDFDTVEIGAVHAFKRFPEPSLYGSGGHTAFVLGYEGQGPDRTVITLGTSRNLEKDIDFSYGVDTFQALPGLGEDGKMRMYFNVRDSGEV